MKKKSSRPTTSEIKTGHRGNPATEGPRDRTVCFMVSEREKIAVDRVAFCIQLTRSGVLARIVSEFIAAANEGRAAKEAERKP